MNSNQFSDKKYNNNNIKNNKNILNEISFLSNNDK